MAEERPLSAADREELVVTMYRAGEKLTTIEREAGVSRSTLYWILEKNGVEPQRANRRSRVLDTATAESLYELIQHQHNRIVELEQVVADNRARIQELEAELARLRG